MATFKFLLIIVFVVFTSQYTYSQYFNFSVFSSGGGSSSREIDSNFSVISQSFVNNDVSGGEYSGSIGFVYACDLLTVIENNRTSIESITIYPNPANDVIYIKSGILKIGSIELLNFLGQPVCKSDLVCSLNISHLNPGIYLLIIKDIEGQILKSSKIIKRK